MRADKAPIIRVDLNKSNDDLIQIAESLIINKTSLLAQREGFKTLFYMVDNNLDYKLFAFIRKNSRAVEYTSDTSKYLFSLPDTTVDKVKEIRETYDRVNNNMAYLLGEKVDNPEAIKKEKHLKKLSFILEDSDKKVVPAVKFKINDVLDKIDQKGIKSLTKAEKTFLEDYSKNL